MKHLPTASCLLSICIISCGHTDSVHNTPQKTPPAIRIDSAKAEAASAVLHVTLIGRGEAGRYIWDTVQVTQVIRNKTNTNFGNTLAVAHYAWKKGIPSSPSVIYITPMPTENEPTTPRWMLLNGNGKTAVTTP